MDLQNINKIRLDMTCKIPLLWNIKDIQFIQENYRIIGRKIGPFPALNLLSKSDKFGLPLTLMKEEAKLLYDKNVIDLVQYPVLKEEPTMETIEKDKEINKELNNQCKNDWLESRIKEIEEKANLILKGKLKKESKKLTSNESASVSVSEPTLNSIKADEIRKLGEREELEYVKIFMEHPFLKDLPFNLIDWSYPETKKDKLKYTIFKDLWEKNYYISCGLKFGGDYLVYSDNPKLYHASFIIKCLDDTKKFSLYDLVLWTRLGTTTQKTLVLSSVDNNGKVQYLSAQWPGKNLDALDDLILPNLTQSNLSK